jgi:hypothetical protein
VVHVIDATGPATMQIAQRDEVAGVVGAVASYRAGRGQR